MNRGLTCVQDGRIGRHCAFSHSQKDNNKFKNKKQPELTENGTVWKSDNQVVKEETFIQTSRRAEIGGQPGGEDLHQGSSWRTGVGKAAAGRQGGGWWTQQGGGLKTRGSCIQCKLGGTKG